MKLPTEYSINGQWYYLVSEVDKQIAELQGQVEGMREQACGYVCKFGRLSGYCPICKIKEKQMSETASTKCGATAWIGGCVRKCTLPLGHEYHHSEFTDLSIPNAQWPQNKELDFRPTKGVQ
jgi:hypothetical protein